MRMESAVDLVQQIGDIAGVFAFAVSGALLAVRKDYDVFGLAVLAVATALGGGVLRDLIIGRVPPAAFTDLGYLYTSLLAAAMVALWRPPRETGRWYRRTRRLRLTRWLDIADAVGLGLFCVLGTRTAFEHGLGAPSAALLGLVTAVGGGIVRDVLAQRSPAILRPDTDLYAIPALFGSVLTAILLHEHWYRGWTALPAAAGAIAFRLLALRYHWRAPRARGSLHR
ncbi:trimeric intracellular cation channel family protein [Nocardia sp. alder85J]|uniref:trimeric intracellular cation channel family protein n=1 Tax=Nocardia sp. alder85J TaxID=2862949 RepID=UPI001CD32901|nr:trimeric intracellular cation channel family protein [Nocardia sp. alder85J]MCX4095142.1 trimeric intracellular cation channel family protein [Nocardia sp. alder85J]